MTLGEFLLELGTGGEERLAEFARDQRAYIERSDLDEPQKEMLLSGDLRKLRIKIEAEVIVGGEKLAIHVICAPTICMPDPGDPEGPSPPKPGR